MSISVRIVGDIRKMMREEAARLERDAIEAVTIVGLEVQAAERQQARSAGLGRGVANAWRMRTYRGSNPASLVYSRTPDIIDAFDLGATIRSKMGRYLAIPTGFNRQGGRRGAKLIVTPAEMARTRGTFARTSKAGTLLWFMPIARQRRTYSRRLKSGEERIYKSRVVDALISGRRIRDRKRRDLALEYGAVPMFILKRQVKLPKRLDLDAVVDRAGARLESLMARDTPA